MKRIQHLEATITYRYDALRWMKEELKRAEAGHAMWKRKHSVMDMANDSARAECEKYKAERDKYKKGVMRLQAVMDDPDWVIVVTCQAPIEETGGRR